MGKGRQKFWSYYDHVCTLFVVNGAAIVTSIICILLLIGLDYVNSLLRKYVKKVPVHIPAQLIVVSVLYTQIYLQRSYILKHFSFLA